jgi:hypothetical protein
MSSTLDAQNTSSSSTRRVIQLAVRLVVEDG